MKIELLVFLIKFDYLLDQSIKMGENPMITLRFTQIKTEEKTKKLKVPRNVALTIPFCGVALHSQFAEASGTITIQQPTTIEAVRNYLTWKVGKEIPQLSPSSWMETVKFAHFMMDDKPFIKENSLPELDDGDFIKEFINLPDEYQIHIISLYFDNCCTADEYQREMIIHKEELAETDEIVDTSRSDLFYEVGNEAFKNSTKYRPRYKIIRTYKSCSFVDRLVRFCSSPFFAEWIWDNVEREQLITILDPPNKSKSSMRRRTFEDLVKFKKKFTRVSKKCYKNDAKEKDLIDTYWKSLNGYRVGKRAADIFFCHPDDSFTTSGLYRCYQECIDGCRTDLEKYQQKMNVL